MRTALICFYEKSVINFFCFCQYLALHTLRLNVNEYFILFTIHFYIKERHLY